MKATFSIDSNSMLVTDLREYVKLFLEIIDVLSFPFRVRHRFHRSVKLNLSVKWLFSCY